MAEQCAQWLLIDDLVPLLGRKVTVHPYDNHNIELDSGILADISNGSICLIGSCKVLEMEVDGRTVNIVVEGRKLLLFDPTMVWELNEPFTEQDALYQSEEFVIHEGE
jgi:hypothetical protein